jgi:hypothetical protein
MPVSKGEAWMQRKPEGHPRNEGTPNLVEFLNAQRYVNGIMTGVHNRRLNQWQHHINPDRADALCQALNVGPIVLTRLMAEYSQSRGLLADAMEFKSGLLAHDRRTTQARFMTMPKGATGWHDANAQLDDYLEALHELELIDLEHSLWNIEVPDLNAINIYHPLRRNGPNFPPVLWDRKGPRPELESARLIDLLDLILDAACVAVMKGWKRRYGSDKRNFLPFPHNHTTGWTSLWINSDEDAAKDKAILHVMTSPCFQDDPCIIRLMKGGANHPAAIPFLGSGATDDTAD